MTTQLIDGWLKSLTDVDRVSDAARALVDTIVLETASSVTSRTRAQTWKPDRRRYFEDTTGQVRYSVYTVYVVWFSGLA